jgi:predicted TIM-barrel fold metal-dependent hydrolase
MIQSAAVTPHHTIVDFHGHWFPPELVAAGPAGLIGLVKKAWPLLTDLDAQLELAAAHGTDVRVINAVLSSVAPAATVSVGELPAKLNDALAAAVAQHGPRIAALATVDPYQGDAGAEEARRAIDQLGLAGLVVDAARGDRLLADPEARPTLEFAAERGVVVFAHPVNPPLLAARFVRTGDAAVLLARGMESALSTLALLRSGLLEELPGLRIVLAGIASPVLHMATFLSEAAPVLGHLYIDTMGFDPAATRYAIDALGPENVLIGSDWPIVARPASIARVDALLAAVDVTAEQAVQISHVTALRLLGRGPREASAVSLGTPEQIADELELRANAGVDGVKGAV